MPNEFLRDRIYRKLATLPDERLYQVLDFVEFLESKYAEQPAATSNAFQRFAEGMEDRLRAGKVSAATISETMNLMHRAIGVLNGVAAAGKSVATDIVGAASRPAAPPAGASASPPPPSAPASAPAAPPTGAAPGATPPSAPSGGQPS